MILAGCTDIRPGCHYSQIFGWGFRKTLTPLRGSVTSGGV